MATAAALSSTVALAGTTTPSTTAQPWKAGQVVDVWAEPPGAFTPEGSASINITIDSLTKGTTTTTGTRIGDQSDSITGGLATEYQFTVPNLGSATGSYYISAREPSGIPMALLSGPSIEDNWLSTFNYVPSASGQLPEVPFAGALPFIGLAGAGVFLFARKRKNANQFAN